MATRRRRSIPPDALAAISDLRARGYTPKEIHAELERSMDRPPHIRAVQRAIRDIDPADTSAPWTMANAQADDGALVLPVVAELIERSEGRRRQITQTEASWIARIRRADASLDPWYTYVLARRYILATKEGGAPVYALDALLAFAPWRGSAERDRYDAATRAPWIPRVPWTVLELTTDGEPTRRALVMRAGKKVQRGKTRKR